jgi:D-glycero-alpha-D-manno-heptose 1-phosphate guanylyltransferase
MEAIILAGGLGTRLQPVISDKPKSLSPVAGKPFLYYVIEYLTAQSVSRFIFSLGYMADQVTCFLKKEYPDLHYDISLESYPLGTGGAIKKALLHSEEASVLIVNADTFFNVDLSLMFQQHVSSSADCTIALKHLYDFDRYGAVEMNGDNRIISFKEKAFRNEGFINGGYLFLEKSSFENRSFPEVFSFEKHFLEAELNNILIKGFVSEGYFIDIGIPSDYEKAQAEFKNYNRLQ